VNVSKRYARLPKGYDGSATTSHSIVDLLPQALEKIARHYELRPDLVLAAWPEVIGPKLAPMTRAVSFINGTLTVKVTNSTLYSLMCQYDKNLLLRRLRQKFPTLAIDNVFFRLG
jgi:hypothetical protein